MNTFHDLARRVDDVAAPTLDLDALIAQGEQRVRRRRTAATTAAVAVLAVAVVGGLAASGLRNQGNGPVTPPEPTPTRILDEDAASVIADGNLASYAANETGAVLKVWYTDECADWVVPDCSFAWSLGNGSQTQAIGTVDFQGVGVNAFGDGFALTPTGHPGHRLDRGLLIHQDGTTSVLPLARDCGAVTWPADSEPGQLVWGPGMSFVDIAAGAVCDTRRLGGRQPLAGDGVFTGDGALWALLDNETTRDKHTLTIGRYDGTQWRYRDLAPEGGSWTSVLAAAGSNIAVLVANTEMVPQPDQLLGLYVSTDGGATWSDVSDLDTSARDLPFPVVSDPADAWFNGYTTMAFAGTSALYVADGNGDLWRSTDFASFSRVSVPDSVADLKPAGDAVIGRLGDGTDLIRISADGSIEPLTDG
jgi:hypothetical protein